MRSSRAGGNRDTRWQGWVGGRGTALCLTFGVVFTAYLFSPAWWHEIGGDTKVFYAAGRVAASGGDPYDVSQLNRMEDDLYNRGPSVPFGHAPYGYPPVVTAVLTTASRLPEAGFYLLSLGILMASGVGGLELWLNLLQWPSRALPRLAFLASAPMALDAFVGNPSAILLLASAATAWLVARGRPLIGGLALSVLSLKPQVGLPLALAILLSAPLAAGGRRSAPRTALLATAGFGLGAAALAGIGLALQGPAASAHWTMTLTAFSAALGPGGRSSAFAQSGLAGLPSLLGPALPLTAAVLVTAAVLAPLLVVALRPGRGVLDRPTVAPMALAIAASLAVSPYLHLNDLVLGACPALFIASQRQDLLTRITLVIWTIGAPLRLVAFGLLGPGFSSGPASQAGAGVFLTGSMLLSVAWVVATRPAGAPGEST
ncbi:MAG: glycosyltransferase 87 family protein [Candidatus Dormibacteria bacterium]